MARSACGVSVSVSLADVTGLVSITEPGTVRLAVLVMLPVAPAAIAALTVNVTDPPLATVTLAAIGPLPLAGHDDEGELAAQVHDVNVTPAGGVSLTPSPVTSFGPAFDTLIVYVVDVPGTTDVTPSVLV